MAHDHNSPSKFEIGTHAMLPPLFMLFIQMFANYVGSPANTIFLSPYLLAFFTACVISCIVLWKGQICPGQEGRLSFVLPFLLIFALGNMLYASLFTPKHSPLLITHLAAVILPFLYWKLPKDEQLVRTLMLSGLAICGIGSLAYLLVYWVEIPSLLNWVRANNFAQVLAGILLAGWYLMLAKSRLEVFLKLLVQLALIVLIFNYIWSLFVLYQEMQLLPHLNLLPYLLFFVLQFVILALLAWLLVGKKGKNIKNPVAWTGAMFLSLLYPLTNIF